MDVRTASEKDRENWNRFVDREGGSFHLYFEWKYYYENNSKKHRVLPLIIEDNSSDILGIFPIEQTLNLVYGYLTSLPLGVSGGFLIKSGLNEQEKKQVIQSFLTYIDENYSGSQSFLTIKEQLSFVEEFQSPSKILLDNGYQFLDNTTTRFPCTYVLNLEEPFKEKIWMGLWSKTLRKRIRQVRKDGVEVIVDDDFRYLDDFIEMQLKSGEKFNRFPDKKDILPIFSIFKSKIKLFICLLDSKPISGALCYFTPTVVHCSMAPYNSIATEYLTNTLPVCASIHYACDHGYRYYDMGRTDTPEIAHHKEKFHATGIPMRIYTKKFSNFKIGMNASYDQVRRFGKNLVRSSRLSQ
jgi:hypothetical protein